jgi:soluble lytic murein transglycosylase-like protein
MQIDPRTMGQVIKSQFANNIDLQGTAFASQSQSNGDSLFDILLQELKKSESANAGLSKMQETSTNGINISELLSEEMLLNLQSVQDLNGLDQTQMNSLQQLSNLINSAAVSAPSLPNIQRGIGNVGKGSRPSGAGATIDQLVSVASQKFGVSEDLIKAVIETESHFNPGTVSSAGAKGLMQLMDGTARGLGVSNSFDPEQNINGGTKYLSYQLKRYNGHENTALAAYNAGPGRLRRLGISNDQELAEKLHLLPKETQRYITKVQTARQKYTV